ncbi:MAG: cell division protein SepF [Lachnospiraceae bacterium]|nr:cell division protein SepF [Lachnospiraceae bacterium]
MSLMDNFLNAMRLNDDEEYDEEYDDEYENDTEDDDDEEEVKEKRQKTKKAPRKENKKPTPKETSRDIKENKEDEREAVKESIKSSSKITPISNSKSTRKQATLGMEVRVIRPTKIDHELEIVDTLLNGRTIVINVEGLNADVAQRIIDFSSGASYAVQGKIQKISSYIFLITPKGVEISGDIQDFMNSFDVYDTGGFML